MKKNSIREIVLEEESEVIDNINDNKEIKNEGETKIEENNTEKQNYVDS